MRISSETVTLEVPKDCSPLEWVLHQLSETRGDEVVLRWGILRFDRRRAVVDVARLKGAGSAAPIPDSSHTPSTAVRDGIHVALVIPTGVAANIGGFVGDAGPIVRVLEEVADSVIVHPNVVNGADFYGAAKAHYVDGLTFDRFLEGAGALQRRSRPRIGLLLDRLQPSSHARVLNAANGWRAVVGVELVGFAICEERLRTRVRRTDEGHFIGDVDNPEVLFEATERLRAAGANCIAAVSDIEDIDLDNWTAHYEGKGANPMGALEALISRAITWKSGLPCAHAPSSMDCIPNPGTVVDPRAAADIASGTGLPSVLHGLARHAALIERDSTFGIAVSDLSAIIVPFGCAGGIPAIAAERTQTPLLGVTENTCRIGVKADAFGLSTLVMVRNYAEAIAFVAARKAGVDWHCLGRPLERIPEIPSRSMSRD